LDTNYKSTVDNADVLGLGSRIIEGGSSQTNDQLYFVGTGKNYIKKDDSGNFMSVNQSGNFYVNTNPVGKKFSDIIDGGNSNRGTSQFIAPLIGGIFPVQKRGI